MTTETKRHIDAARQVLVGVVPNPTSQIDQITNALIYKFMDDMDQSAIKQGGSPSFFVGDLKQYAWTRLMDARIGNQERMNIYSEALIKFSESKQLPQLFREIFKSAFLPYRSPEVLGLFLKEISYFDYSHPEELGNAYEYLLSIMSSQGDAGQFRTPRHIIDFMVDVVNPTSEDKVLDPACGTGGFLVSAYKHILQQHDGEKPLTPDQRKNLMGNFEGYDVDPGMVRIAQVNMYLHQFKNPKIFQYDTLSMEERWGDKFNIILANPPFMSPKGGVSTHSKFSIQSTRSEVLFVDYIMNHLRPQGRAGIIVPEGIIFQSGSSHKQLRKNLVEDGLYAVVSLPSGVFQPYSGVKTSILFFNNELAKQSKEILFLKIENDGFDLGSTKRPISKNDLPRALDVLTRYRQSFSDKKVFLTGRDVQDGFVQLVDKAEIAKNEDYNLSGERYRTNAFDFMRQTMDKLERELKLHTVALEPMIKMTEEYAKAIKALSRPAEEIQRMINSPFFKSYTENVQKAVESIQKAFNDKNFKQVAEKIEYIKTQQKQKWPMVELGDVVEILDNKRKPITKSDRKFGQFPYYGATGILDYVDNYIFDERLVLIGEDGAKWGVGDKTAFIAEGKYWVNNHAHVVRPIKEKLIDSYLVSFLNNIDLSSFITGVTVPKLNQEKMRSIKIPLPPVDVQEQITAELDGYANIIAGARQIISSWKTSFIVDPEWEKVKLREIAEYFIGLTYSPEDVGEKGTIVLRSSNVQDGELDFSNIVRVNKKIKENLMVKDGDILMCSRNGSKRLVGKIAVIKNLTEEMTFGTFMTIIRSKYNKFLSYFFVSDLFRDQIDGSETSSINQITKYMLDTVIVPLPPVDVQEQITNRIESERVFVEGNKKLIKIYEQKTKDVLAKLWSE